MEAPHDSTKTKHDLMNFSGSAGDMMAAMSAAGIVVSDAKEAALKVAAAPAGEPAACDDPSCTVDHGHGGHDHGHDHGHKCTVDHDHGGHDHGHEHGHKKAEHGHDHGHEHGHKAAAAAASSPVAVSAEFDSGNIIVVDASDPGGQGVQLRVRPDVYTELEKKAHGQWFHFKASNLSDGAAAGGAPPTKFVVANAKQCSFPDAWPGTTVCASLDRKTWFRCLDTVYDDAKGTLAWSWAAAAHPGAGAGAHSKVAWFAYFAPYSWERHQDFLAEVAASPFAKTEVIGQTLDGRDLDLVTVGDGPRKVWVISRQHPGEPQAEFFCEGLLRRLTDRTDALARQVRAKCTVYCIPNMNPDGSVRGHLRTNAAGANLNREWCSTGDYEAPTLLRSPEVFHCLDAMDKTGVDMFVDVHGDEEIPMNFVSGMEGLAAWGPRLEALQGAFVASYVRANPDMQGGISYEPEPPGKANLAICSNQVAHRFGCLGVTFEQPFKDCATLPDEAFGWTPERCAKLGASLVDVVAHCEPHLRNPELVPADLGPADAYVRPVEGNANSMLPHFAAGNTYNSSSSVAVVDAQLREAAKKIDELRLQRARIMSE